jgi:nucleoside-diphosphate-sugar epimerase
MMSLDGGRRKTACVTGGSGYIASVLIKTLLERGYAVKTTVRDPGSVFFPCASVWYEITYVVLVD